MVAESLQGTQIGLFYRFSTVLHNFGGSYIPAGQYSFPFSFKTGENYPSTFRVPFVFILGKSTRPTQKRQNKIWNASIHPSIQLQNANSKMQNLNCNPLDYCNQKLKAINGCACEIMLLRWPRYFYHKVLLLKECILSRWRCKNLLHAEHPLI